MRVHMGPSEKKLVPSARVLLVVGGAIALACGCAGLAVAQSEGSKSREFRWIEERPLSATVSVEVPNRVLPEGLAEREIRIEQLEPLPFDDLVARVAEVIGVEAVIEERPGRVADGESALDTPVPFGLAMTAKVPEVLDEVGRLSGYAWTWSGDRLVFYRYGDIEWRRALSLPRGFAVDVLAVLAENEREAEAAAVAGAYELDGGVAHEEMDPQGRVASGVSGQVAGGPGGRVDPAAVAAVEGQGEAAPADQEPAERAGWEVDPARHETVEGVLRAWSERAGWNLAWESERQFRVGAAAEFEPGATEKAGFLAAADALLAIAPMRRTLTATAYPNRWLVVRDVGSAGQ